MEVRTDASREERRIATEMHLIDSLRMKAPGPADDIDRPGRKRAAGGTLPADYWNELVARLGVGPGTSARA